MILSIDFDSRMPKTKLGNIVLRLNSRNLMFNVNDMAMIRRYAINSFLINRINM